MNTLFLITARGGSKGIPGKNIKLLGGKPLIAYSIDMARQFVADHQICISTDSEEIIRVVENYGLKVPFVRPAKLATDTAGSYEVILHALNWYKQQGRTFDNLVLLQPTSPFRLKRHLDEAFALYNSDTDMVTSVKKVRSNIFATYYTSTGDGFIKRLFKSADNGERRQDVGDIFELNGAVYIINCKSISERKISEFTKIKYIEMDELHSADIDEPIDWDWCEFVIDRLNLG